MSIAAKQTRWLLPLSLVALLLARGPVCGFLCELPAFDLFGNGTSHQAASPQPCHGPAAPEQPEEHQDCPGCEELLLGTPSVADGGAAVAPLAARPLPVAAEYLASTLELHVVPPPWHPPPIPSPLLEKSTLLI